MKKSYSNFTLKSEENSGSDKEAAMATEIKEEPAEANVGREVFTATRSTRQSVARREREDSFSSGGMSLDVLAQVATETLEKEPVPQKKSSGVSTSS